MNDNLNALPLGSELNHYIIESVLGSGGFGIVYKAHHAHLDEQVVIKEFLPVELAGRHGNTVTPHATSKQELYSECLRRFMEEGRTLVKLRHPNVVRCRDLFTANGTAYLVMDFEDGLPLDELVRSLEAQGSRYTEQQLLHFLKPLADGLAYIHSQGVLHRDIKPANVFIRRSDGSPVIIDFGAAKQNFALASQSQAPFTEFYAPIEQIEGGGEAKPTVDIHAFGALMYRVVTGQVGPKAEARAMALAYGKPDPMPKASELNGGHYSTTFLSVIDQCLAFKAAERPQSMATVSANLAQIDGSNAAKTTPVAAGQTNDVGRPQVNQAPVTHNKAKSGGRWLALIACMLVIVGGFGLYQWLGTADKLETAEARVLRLAADDAYFKTTNYADAFRLYNLASAKGSAYADAQLAKMHGRGMATVKDVTLAQQFRSKAEQQFALSSTLGGYEHYLLGSMADFVADDLPQAVEYYRKAAKQGDAYGQNNLGFAYHEGKGIAQSYTDAVYWYQKAAEQGHANSQNNLAVMYRDGLGVAQSDSEAVNLFRKAAEQGHANGQNNLGWMYDRGRGVAQSDTEALAWYQKAAAQDNATAQNNMGRMYFNGKGVAQSDTEAVTWYRKAAEQGNAFAQDNLGWMYENGRGVAQSDIEALAWYQKAAAQDNANAQNNIGRMYFNGKGVAQSDLEAVTWYQKAAAQGNADAQTNLGWMYSKGLGVEKSDTEAVTWYEKAAAQGHATAQNNLGLMYENGRGVTQSYAEALSLYSKAAEQNNLSALDNLGWMHLLGKGTTKSPEQAASWFLKAAELGNAASQNKLGTLYQNGEGVKQSDTDAVKWYRKAADQGNANAQNNLGVMYRYGRGVTQSNAEAEKWYRKAAAQGNPAAITNLKNLGVQP